MNILRKIISPTSVALPRKTKKDKIIHLNLNIYRNLHPMVEHQCKDKYAENCVNQDHDRNSDVKASFARFVPE